MTSAPKRFPLGLDDLVRVPASKTGKQGSKTGAQGSAGDKANIGVKTATKATVAHAGFDSKKKAPGAGVSTSRPATAPTNASPRASTPTLTPTPTPAPPRAAPATASGQRAPALAPVPGARPVAPVRVDATRISPEQRSRAAALATAQARPPLPGPAVSAVSPVVSSVVSSGSPAATSGPTRILTRVPVPPRAERPVAAAAKPAAQVPMQTPMRASPSSAAPANFSLTSERVRERMVERVRASGVSDPRVLAAMAAVPRHLFVDPGFATQAYEEAALPIGHHQTISKPSVVARMIELAANGRVLDNVLEIGTGCGYQAAVLSGVARDVYSIERIRPLYERAKQNLRPLRIPNIRLHYGDGRLGMPKVAPFDAIVIAAAGLDVPQALLEQLQIGGRLIAPVGAQSQVLTLVERVAENQWHESQLDRVFFVPLKSGVI
jgi:protein-L-isoaspartate(D-aspartate) O-methyltransferase